MSDKGKRKREWRCYVQDMIGFCEKVETWTEGLDREDLAADELVYDAVLGNLELVGAAEARVPDADSGGASECPLNGPSPECATVWTAPIIWGSTTTPSGPSFRTIFRY